MDESWELKNDSNQSMTVHGDIMKDIIGRLIFEPWDHITRDQIEQEFRRSCPGPYRLIWSRELDEDFLPQYRLEFDDQAAATFWYLKWT
jgi:hypothetical protein